MGKNEKKNKLTGPRAGGVKWAGRTVLCCERSTGTQDGEYPSWKPRVEGPLVV